MKKNTSTFIQRLFRRLRYVFSLSVLSLIYISCATVDVATVKKKPDSFRKILEKHAILCVSFDVSIQNDLPGLTDRMTMQLLLFDESEKSPRAKIFGSVVPSVSGFRQGEDNDKFYYLKVKPGTYYFGDITTTKTLGDMSFGQTFEYTDKMKELDWKMRVAFLPRHNYTKISSGEIIYIGSFKLTGNYEPSGKYDFPGKYRFTSVELIDRFDEAQTDLDSILSLENSAANSNGSNKLAKRLYLRSDSTNVEHRILN